MSKRYVTLEQANALLPKLGGFLRQMLQLRGHLRPMTEQLDQAGVRVTSELLEGGAADTTDRAALRLVAHAQALYASIRESIEAIEALGGELKDLETGLVDFHSLRDGTHEVLLCWRMGEAEITHYHEEHTGFSGRQPVQGHEFVSEARAVTRT